MVNEIILSIYSDNLDTAMSIGSGACTGDGYGYTDTSHVPWYILSLALFRTK